MKNINTLSGLSVANFSKQIDGKETALYTLCNKVGAELAITNYGAKIVSLMVPDKNGKMTDVVTGHNSIEEYLTSENLIRCHLRSLWKSYRRWKIHDRRYYL